MILPIKSNELVLPKQVIDDFCATMGSRKRSFLILYGIFLELIRQLYSDSSNLLLGLNTVWNNDVNKSGIWIDTEYMWEDKNPEFRPAIYIALDALNKSKLVVDDAIGSDLAEGVAYYARRVDSTARIVHIGHTKGETVNLVSNTADYLEGLSKVIRDDFCFLTFEVISVTPLKVYKESKDNLRGEVVIKYSYDDTWSIKTESPKLKKIIYSTRQSVINLIQ